MPDRLDIDLTALKRYEAWLQAGLQDRLDWFHSLPFAEQCERAAIWAANQDCAVDRWLMRYEAYGDNQ